MGFKKKENFQRFEAENIDGFDDGLSGALDALEQAGLNNSNDEPETVIVLRNNVKGPEGERRIQAIAYNGATIDQITEDLKSRK